MYLLYKINEKYFGEQAFYMDGEKIQILDKQSINVLMDQETAQKEEWYADHFTRLTDVDVVIYLYEEADYISYDQEDYRNYENKQAPIFVYTSHPEAFEPNITAAGVYFDGEQMKETEDYLNAVGIGEHLIFRSTKEEEKLLTEQFFYTVRMELMRFLPGLLSLVVLFVAFGKFVLLAKQKKWQVLKSVGFRTTDLTKDYLFQLILLNIIVIVSQYVLLDTILWGSVGLLVFFSLCSYFLLNQASIRIKIN